MLAFPPGSLRCGLQVPWLTVLLIAAINTGIAGVLWIDDPRPFWQPLISVQCFGFSIAYCVSVASPWDKRHPVARLAVAIGSLIAMLLVIAVKGYPLDHVTSRFRYFALTTLTGFTNGLFVSLFFMLKFRETRAQSALLKAQAERHLLSYLRAALPQLRTASTALGKEVEMAEAYLNILKMRMGPRLEFSVDVPDALRAAPFPPGLLISVVENAVEHGLETQAGGGAVRIDARRDDNRLVVTVTDSGGGIVAPGAKAPGRGVGLSNVRERLAALYGSRGRFALENAMPRGARGSRSLASLPAAVISCS